MLGTRGLGHVRAHQSKSPVCNMIHKLTNDSLACHLQRTHVLQSLECQPHSYGKMAVNHLRISSTRPHPPELEISVQ